MGRKARGYRLYGLRLDAESIEILDTLVNKGICGDRSDAARYMIGSPFISDDTLSQLERFVDKKHVKSTEAAIDLLAHNITPIKLTEILVKKKAA